MRKPDIEVREVVCSETGKPMPKIPLWMADIKVKFVSEEARQKHPPSVTLNDLEPLRRAIPADDPDDAKELGAADPALEDADDAFDEIEGDEAEAEL